MARSDFSLHEIPKQTVKGQELASITTDPPFIIPVANPPFAEHAVEAFHFCAAVLRVLPIWALQKSVNLWERLPDGLAGVQQEHHFDIHRALLESGVDPIHCNSRVNIDMCQQLLVPGQPQGFKCQAF